MSRFIFNGITHTITLLDNNEEEIGKWTAYNNIDSPIAGFHFLHNGIYNIIDRNRPHTHSDGSDSENGSYGPYGIIRFEYPGHTGVGVHSGRTHWRRTPGPEHPTRGCIRTTDETMRIITNNIRLSPLTTIDIRHNEPGDQDDPSETKMYQPVRIYLI
ncbi:hypothetical protein E1B77_23770 [Salmonella enterica subsp. enterica]|nr:hypothetical protein [Salmonella enterica subsp. enterica]